MTDAPNLSKLRPAFTISDDAFAAYMNEWRQTQDHRLAVIAFVTFIGYGAGELYEIQVTRKGIATTQLVWEKP